MIRHIVMWRFRRDMEQSPTEVAREMKSRLEALNGKIDGLIRAEVGVNCRESASSFDAVLTADFESWEAMDAYKIHPLHVVISDYCKSRREERVDVDYEI
ncbi:MAG: Dabb family protein [Alistipes sp.]|nr:Dabb family protein [Alistipes sp.]